MPKKKSQRSPFSSRAVGKKPRRAPFGSSSRRGAVASRRADPKGGAGVSSGRPARRPRQAERNSLRQPANLEKIFGKHSCRAVLKTRPRAVRRLLLLHGKLEPPAEFLEMAEAAGIAPEILGWEEFLREGDFQEEENHQGVCLFARQRELLAEKDLKSLAGARVVLALDQLSDPRNLGAILRGAAFFGVDAVLLLKNRAAPITPAVTRIAVGGAEFVKIFEVTNLARSLDLLKKLGFWVFGLDERGEKSLVEADFGEKAVLVIGAEGEGLRQRTAEFCDELVKIPGGRAGVESLNAAVAATIALAEVFRGGSARGTVG